MGADLYRTPTDPEAQRRLEEAHVTIMSLGMRTEMTPEERTAYTEAEAVKYGPEWYFRDSYNASSLLWMIGLSWWQDVPRYQGPNADGVLLQQTEDGESYDVPELYPEGARKLAAEVRSRSELLMYTCHQKGLPEVGKPFVNIFGEDDRELDMKYFSEKFDALLAFLEGAADAGDTIYCSL